MVAVDAGVIGRRRWSVVICAWRASAPFQAAGLGSLNPMATRGRSAAASSLARVRSPASARVVISTNSGVQRWAVAEMAPAPPMSTVGVMNASVTRKDLEVRFAAGKQLDGVEVERADGLLEADDPRVLAHLDQRGGAECAPGSVGNVVRDDRHRAGVGNGGVVLDDGSFGGPRVVRDNDEGGRGRCAGGQVLDLVDRPTGAVGSCPHDQRAARGLAGSVAGLDDAPAFLGGERRRLAGCSESDQPGGAIGQDRRASPPSETRSTSPWRSNGVTIGTQSPRRSMESIVVMATP